MSEENPIDKSCCASCGVAELDDIKLVPCDDCDLVKYCCDDCKENHKSEHQEDCKKRAAELRDELLFKQPESTHLGDCPICYLPMPLDAKRFTSYECCSKVICCGCILVNGLSSKCSSWCPFCREPVAKTDEEHDKRMMKRAEANNPVAMFQWGKEQHKRGDYSSTFEYWTKAAKLGDAEAHWALGDMYRLGQGVEKDEGKVLHHYEEASILGHPMARYNLGVCENNNGNIERAVKHWIIAAAQGYDVAIKALMNEFRKGYVEKEVLAATLRAHKAAVDATKSPQRHFEEKIVPKLLNRSGSR